MTGDSENPNDEVQYHLGVGPDDVDGPVLLPGDPERVPKIADYWEMSEETGSHREYRTMTGTYDGAPVTCTSTGIGSPSATIAVEEHANIGTDTFIRVGSCGAIQEGMNVGDLVITTGAVRQEGTSSEYIREDYPATADGEVVTALVTACEELGYDYHTGVTCSTDSFYAGQGRPGHGGFEAAGAGELVEELQNAGVLNFEMEAASILTVASLYGLRAGAVCTVYANRITGEFRTEGERRAGEVASRASAILAEMDAVKDEVGADRWHAGLSLDR
ncbi:nucleoside phosphorylase [Halorarius litoreus]|uniref:nucleoside phosphorylase n=1 Tax=Halorarius litoreus TaxID=2962676 RepID=UPI0020CCB4C9|nr:nucleoside phosphorylase [Halorarius litoreus]